MHEDYASSMPPTLIIFKLNICNHPTASDNDRNTNNNSNQKKGVESPQTDDPSQPKNLK